MPLINNQKVTILYVLVSIIAGLSLLLKPEDVSLWIIRGVGLVWVLEGIFAALQYYIDKLSNKL